MRTAEPPGNYVRFFFNQHLYFSHKLRGWQAS
jgi:hypothetical protein